MSGESPTSSDSTANTEAPPLRGVWGSVLTMTPVVLTVLATAFAGLSTSEMTYAMYYRSVAAEHQSKAGDQWAFFQAKRIRGTTMETTADLLDSLGHPEQFDPADIDAVSAKIIQALEKPPAEGDSSRQLADKVKAIREKLAMLLANGETQRLLPFLTGSELPKIDTANSPKKGASASVEAAVDAISQRKPDAAIAVIAAKLRDADIDEAQRAAEDNADAFGKACDPISNLIAKLRSNFNELGRVLKPLRKSAYESSPQHPAVMLFDRINNGFKASALDFDSRRYRQEAFWNRKVAEILEVRVRRANVESDRHRERSKQFFYSMLVAQAGVTVASLALARQRHSLLWVFAAVAGLVSLGFTAWVYLTF
jgi:hypothetical protein